MPFYVGLDLGQAADYTALAVVHSVQTQTPEGQAAQGLHLRHLERYPLRTPYPEIVEKVAALVRDEKLSPTEYDPSRGCYSSRPPALVVDNTGVGVAVTDLLKGKGLRFTRVTITGGNRAHKASGNWRVPKRDLVAALEVSFHTGELKLAKGLKLWPSLREELLIFRRKINVKTAHDSYEHWRETDHDDLVLATALACWQATRRSVLRVVDMQGRVRSLVVLPLRVLPLSMNPNPYCMGLDLGQSNDYTPLAIVDTVGNDGRVTRRRSQRCICT